jgi:hypothetical protein
VTIATRLGAIIRDLEVIRAEIASAPPEGARRYVEERSLGSGQIGDLADVVTEQDEVEGSPRLCQICGGGYLTSEHIGDGIWRESCPSCTYSKEVQS